MAVAAHTTYHPKFEGRTVVATVMAMQGNVVTIKLAKRKFHAPVVSTGGRRA